MDTPAIDKTVLATTAMDKPAVGKLAQSGVNVRVAVPQDAPALAQLCQAHAAFEHIDYRPAGHAQRLAQALQAGRVRAWLAERDGLPLGYASVTLDFATLDARPFAHLDCLYLAPDARGLGLGRALMEVVRQFAQAQGCINLQWQTPAWNQPAIDFYDKTGARKADKQRYVWVL